MTTRSHVVAAGLGSTLGLVVGLLYGAAARDLDLIPRRGRK